MSKIQVSKRRGGLEDFDLEKIRVRLRNLQCNLQVDTHSLAQKVADGICNSIRTVDIDSQLAKTADAMSVQHPDYSILAGRIMASNLHRQINVPFSANVRRLHEYKNPVSQKPEPLFCGEFAKFVAVHAAKLDGMIDNERDMNSTYFSVCTTVYSLPRINNEIAELPQFMHLRVAVWLNMHLNAPTAKILQLIKETYDRLSLRMCSVATPTAFGAGRAGAANLVSCVLMDMQEDSMEGIMDTVKNCAIVSKVGSGVGCSVTRIRCDGSTISGGYKARGLIALMKMLGATFGYANQRNTRPGVCAPYVEMWHADVPRVLQFLRSDNLEYAPLKDIIFPGLWIPDLFFKRVRTGGVWSFMCPKECPGLMDRFGDDFERLYEEYEAKGQFRSQMPVLDVLAAIVTSVCETGVPYLCAKDTANRYNMQANLGVIYNSNLCCEIFLRNGVNSAGQHEIAVCNLATMCLPMFVHDPDGIRVGSLRAPMRHFDFPLLVREAQAVTHILNSVIDITHYPLEEMRRSNMRHRPIGLGIQGFADVCVLLGLAYGSEESIRLAANIAEAIYFGALRASCDLAKEYGPYRSYSGSPLSKGQLHFDLYGASGSGMFDWKGLRKDIAKHGVCNSVVCAYPPTATTSSSTGNNEGMEPFTYLKYTRKVSSGQFSVSNKHLFKDIGDLGLSCEGIAAKISKNMGSVQGIEEIPDTIQSLYRTAFELDPFSLIDVAAAVQPFVDQGMSLNWYRPNKDPEELLMLVMYAWSKGLKTLKYYLHSQAGAHRTSFDGASADKPNSEKTSAQEPDVPSDTVSRTNDTHTPDDGETTNSGDACTRQPGCESCSA